MFLSSLITLVLISLFMVDGASSVDGYGLARAVTSLAWPVIIASLMEAFTSQVKRSEGGKLIVLCSIATESDIFKGLATFP